MRGAGVTIVLGSFFVYYPLVSLFPRASFYNIANYATFILGLFLTFFEISALKQAFIPLFLIVAATLNYLLFDGLEPLLSPYINHFISQTQQNNLQTYQTFYYQRGEKLRIFYYRKSKLDTTSLTTTSLIRINTACFNHI